jgi:hypothetical protein
LAAGTPPNARPPAGAQQLRETPAAAQPQGLGPEQRAAGTPFLFKGRQVAVKDKDQLLLPQGSYSLRAKLLRTWGECLRD